MTTDLFTTLSIDLIDMPEARARALNPDWVEALAVLICNQGLFQPISVRAVGARYHLVSGARRLAAVRMLGWTEIACRISTAASDDAARLEEVMENLGREELIALDRCQHLYELKQVWERMYPETAHGKATPKTQSLRLSSEPQEIFGFARANAENIGLSKRSIELAVQIWMRLCPMARDRLVGTPLARKQTELKALSDLSSRRQAQVLDLILGEEDVTNVAGALQALEGGMVPDPVEKQLAQLRKQVGTLPDPVFDRLILENEERVMAALKRQGRLG